MSDPWLEIDCGPRVVALQTTCDPEPAPYGSFNLGLHVGDDVGAVVKNRVRLASYFGEEVYFPEQIHGINVVRVDQNSPVIAADAVVTDQLYCPIGIMTADCLPLLFASQDSIGAVHAGWRGLVSGVVERTLKIFMILPRCASGLAPALAKTHLKLGQEVVDAFVFKNSDWDRYFESVSGSDRSIADLRGIASDLLENLGVVTIKGLDICTYSDSTRWYSYRRSGVTGRMASCIMRTG